MIVTFYSYKGGVGRSMALANIACLLAEDREHPQRVLVWDFDLEAPGLHRLFPAPEPIRHGFVDLAFEYASSGEMPDISEYVYHSELERVDVLPAGRVDDAYCRKLERIDWLGFFGKEPSERGEFFDALTAWMDSEPQKYDYVLVDSRTGLNDVAGICTQVIPDIVLFIFRLTDQNLDGIEHLVPAVRTQLRIRGRDEVKVLPVASVVLSQSSKEIAAKRKRAEAIFGRKDKELDYIRFDADLVAGERLFCRDDVKSSMWPVPPIVDDYARLCKSLRQMNSDDTRTAARRLHRVMGLEDYAAARELLDMLLRRRPKTQETWMALRWLCAEKKDEMDFADRLAEDIYEEEPENPFALEWMASKLATEAKSCEDEKLREAYAYLERAVGVEPELPSLYREIADVASAIGDLERATEALEHVRKLWRHNAQVPVDVAHLYIRRGQLYFVKALEALGKEEPEPDEKLPVYLWAFLGDSQKAERAFQGWSEESPRCHGDPEFVHLVNAHRMLLEGHRDQAMTLANGRLAAIEKKAHEGTINNWAEFFVCAEDFARARELSPVEESKTDKQPDSCVLRLLVDYFDAKEGSNEADVLQQWGDRSWDFTELLFFRERVMRSGDAPYGNRLGIIERLIRKSALGAQSTRSQSVFWRRATARGRRFGGGRRLVVTHGPPRIQVDIHDT